MNLPNSRDRAVSIGDLAESYGRSRRSVERELEQMVLDGIPVIACERGVYVAQTPQEALDYADSLTGRIAAVSARASALRRWAAAQRVDGQETLPWVA